MRREAPINTDLLSTYSENGYARKGPSHHKLPSLHYQAPSHRYVSAVLTVSMLKLELARVTAGSWLISEAFAKYE